MRYVLLFIIYFTILIITFKKLTREEDIVSILIGALAIHVSIAFIGFIIFLFYYFW
jgi:hypothetical protein